VAQADVRTRFEDMAMKAASTSIEALHKQLRAEQFRWTGVVKSLGLNQNPLRESTVRSRPSRVGRRAQAT